MSLNSASMLCMGQCSALVTSLTRVRSTAVLNLEGAFSWIRCGAATHGSSALGKIYPKSRSCVTHLFNNFRLSSEHLLRLSYNVGFDGFSLIFSGGNLAGGVLPSSSLKIVWYFFITSRCLLHPWDDKSDFVAYWTLISSSFFMASGGSSPRSTSMSQSSKPSGSCCPLL